MKCQKLIKLAMLMVSPLASYALDCLKESDLNNPDCQKDILIITNVKSDGGDERSGSFKAVVNTLEKYDIGANQLQVPQSGILDSEIEKALYKDNMARYSVLVFPEGRVSYNQQVNSAENEWASALTYDQWEKFYEYSRNTNKKLVFLNDYPGNYTGTADYVDTRNLDKNLHKSVQNIVPVQDALNQEVAEAVSEVSISTAEIWHYPAVESPSEKITSVEKLLMFQKNNEITEDTIAAVTANYDGAQYASFFMPLGSWDEKGSDALNIIWLTWGLEKDFSKIAGKQVSAKDAIKSDAPKSSKLELIFVALCTLLTISVTFF